MLVTVFPEGVQIFRVFTDSTRLASYRDTISYRYTKSKIKSQSRTPQALTLETDSGEFIAIGSVYAWNSDGDSVYGTIDTARQGGKSIFREVFPPGSLEALAAGGRTVTVDPTITIGAGLNLTDGFLVQEAPYDTLMLGAHVQLYAGYTGTYTWRSLMRFYYSNNNGISFLAPALPVGRYIQVSLKLYSTGWSAGVASNIGLYLVNGPDAVAGMGNAATWTYNAGIACWKYRRANSELWANGVGLGGVASRVGVWIPGSSGVPDSISFPARLLERRWGMFLIRSQGEASSNCATLASENNATLGYRPTLTVQYTYAEPRRSFGGGLR